jgi:hypothetical protein
MATGRTSPRFCKIQIEDTGGVMRDFPVKTIGDVGLTYQELDVSAMQEIVIGFLTGQATFSLDITGPFDNKAAATASVSGEAASAHLSGSHTVLQPLNGGLTAKSFAVYFGIQADWTTGDPVFGAVDSVIVSNYTHNPSTGEYSCKITKAATAVNDPAWGTTAIAAS